MNIQVTYAARVERKEARPAAPVTAEQDIRRSMSASIPELSRMVPGLDVARSGESQWAVRATARDARARLDTLGLDFRAGRPVADPRWRFAGRLVRAPVAPPHSFSWDAAAFRNRCRRLNVPLATGRLPAVQVPGYVRVDLRLGWRPQCAGEHLEFQSEFGGRAHAVQRAPCGQGAGR